MGNLYLSSSSIVNESSDEKGAFDLESIQEFSNKGRLYTCKVIVDKK